MEQLTDVIYILTLSDSDKYIAMGKKGKKASNSGKKKKQSRDTSLPVLENNDANGIIDQQVADELAFIRKDKRLEFCNDLINHKLLLPNKPDMNINPLVMRQQLLSTNEQTTTSKRLIRAQNMIDEIDKIQSDRGDYYKNEKVVDISTLKNDESYIRECVLWIKAFTSSDFHVLIVKKTLDGSPLPSCCMNRS